LHRDIRAMADKLGFNLEASKNYEIAQGVRLFPVDSNSEDYPGDTDMLGDLSLPLLISRPQECVAMRDLCFEGFSFCCSRLLLAEYNGTLRVSSRHSKIIPHGSPNDRS